MTTYILRKKVTMGHYWVYLCNGEPKPRRDPHSAQVKGYRWKNTYENAHRFPTQAEARLLLEQSKAAIGRSAEYEIVPVS